MKKIISVLLVIIITALTFSLSAFATTPSVNMVSQSTEYLEDGSYEVTTITESSSSSGIMLLTATSYRNGTRSVDHYDNYGDLCWNARLTCSFSYDGSTSRCLSASTSYTIYSSSWGCSNNTASRSGNTGYGNFSFKKYLLGVPLSTMTTMLTLKCSASGVLSF